MAGGGASEVRLRGPMSGMTRPSTEPRYALVTAAYNEKEHIEKTLESVGNQTILPRKWVIVSDGSTDGTDDIVREYAKGRPFIELVRREKGRGYDFASKVHAFQLGVGRVVDMSVDFVGNLDADVSFEPSYFAELLRKFECDPDLGVAGGAIHEWDGEQYRPRPSNREHAVAGAVQMFRRPCFEDVGGLLPLKNGGEDWCAQVMARMNGWSVQTFPELEIRHHRPTGTTAGIIRYRFRQGLMDYSLGSGLLFEGFRICRRLFEYPALAGAMARLCGYVWAYLGQRERPVPAAVVAYLHHEESRRLWRLKKIIFDGSLYRNLWPRLMRLR